MRITEPGIYMARIKPRRRNDWTPTQYFWFYKQMSKTGKSFKWRAVSYVDYPHEITRSYSMDELDVRSGKIENFQPKINRVFPASIPYEEGSV